MAKKIDTLIGICGCRITIDEDDLGFEEVECQSCGTTTSCPETWEEVEKQNSECVTEERTASHYRIMARGEDGTEFCIKNFIAKDNELEELIVAGAKTKYPHATVWVEDEETTMPAPFEHFRE